MAMPKRSEVQAAPGGIALVPHNCNQGKLISPAASTNGTKIPGRPSVTRGLRLHAGTTITYYKERDDFTPTGAPAVVVTKTTDQDIPLAETEAIFVTVNTGFVAEWIA